MKNNLFIISLLFALLLSSLPATSWAQGTSRRGQNYWYTVQNDVFVLRNGSTTKVLLEAVQLPNGSRLEPRTRDVLLPNGQRERLNQDDMVTPSGIIVRVNSGVATPAPAPVPVATPKVQPFSYVPPVIAGGKLRGVVELGASGFNSFIVRIDGQHNWKLEKSEFGNSLVTENLATEDDVRRGLKAYIGQMLDFGVSGRDIHFVVSSGAAEASITRRITASLKALGYVVHTVSAAEEGAMGLRAALPPSFVERGFMVDIGSANTKLGWLAPSGPVVLNSFGSKYYQQGHDDASVAADVTTKAGLVPVANRQTCFIIGGVPFELAKSFRQGQESYTVLRPPAEYAQQEGAKIKAGLNIYRAVAKATGCEQFVFCWDANFTIGYLLSLP